jgi:Pyruvate phosphate dikinase, AMP/ATP-binding domain
MIERGVLGLEEIDETQVALVGGKGANLGELSRIEGIRVPPGFCVTTDAFRRIMATAPWIGSPASRAGLLRAVGGSDPLIGDALQAILERGDFIPILPDEHPGETPAGGAPAPIETDPAIVAGLMERGQVWIATLKRDIRATSGPALLDFILADLQELKRFLFEPPSLQVIMAAMGATSWLNEHLQAWLGEKNAADALTQSAPNNVTAGALAGPAGRCAEGRGGQADDRPGPDLRRVPGVSEVPHGQPLRRLQAGLAA